ncbi:hypothetical protein KSF_085620 [Reticulibacter mediterranei]|uniref:Uncharacterized protein n=1 Tax=Reticulibacter mediterranei TaxID=2778369 RepID=A0A8J3N4Y0_9CHLR|nr:hypothetical protein [Reticulibacter mediterranei]GHO98514.1 hypothetical protein KSF_085620 [Reticulibacter mediterranei]
MWLDEAKIAVWKAGEVVPAGGYVRIDTRSYRLITLEQEGPLPASFDGQVALYRAVALAHQGRGKRQE